MRCKFAGIEMDTLLLSFNATDQAAGGHGKRVLQDHSALGKIAMKTLGGDGVPILRHEKLSMETALRYVLSHGFATAIVGTHTLEQLEENVGIIRGFQPFSEEELREIEQRVGGTGRRLMTLTT